jgi:flagellar biosynthetic protein FlhB
MMNADDRTEAPTPRRLQEARKKGQVAVSRDLAAALVLVAAASTLYLSGSWIVQGLKSSLGRSLASIHELTPAGASAALVSTGTSMLGSAAPLILLAFLAGAAATVVQTGFLFTGETLRFRPERLDPLAGLRRVFSMPTFVGIGGGLAKGAVILAILAGSAWQERLALASLSTRPLPEALAVFSSSALSMVAKTALALLALGLVDWAYRRWQHRRDLRMSRREIQDELREFEADPAVRDRRRTHHGRLAEARALDRVSGAAVVVTDTSDLSVALGFEEEIVAVGTGAQSDRIRESALNHGVPVLERADLARALHRQGKAGAAVPEGLREEAARAVDVGREMRS